jgi:arylsulfatase A-like enzyme
MFQRIPRSFLFHALLIVTLLPHISIAATKPNIILITLDSTRADRMDFLGAKAGITPSLDALARQSMIFDHAYSQVPLTVASHATILSGTYPQTHSVSEFGNPLPASLPFIPQSLHSSGYRTAAFVGSIWLDPKNGFAPGFNRGFDIYDAGFHQSEPGQRRFSSVERQGTEAVTRANAWLARGTQQPFFLWVHINDPHFPYGASYDSAVKAADVAVGKLIATLQARKLYDDALIVVTSDHGESLGAHGEETHGIFLYDETIHIPLLLKLPQNQGAGKRISTRVKLVDVAPTILEVSGVAIPSQMQGQSLLRIAKTNPSSDQPAYARTDFPQKAFGWSTLESWRSGKYLYIRAPNPELYDLSTDPGATHNLAQSSKATLETIASQLDAFDRHFTDQGKATGSALSSSEIQKLASLGYVGLQKPTSPVSTAASGVDPKDGIATANKVLSALELLNDGRPERAVPVLQSLPGSGTKTYLAQYALGVALARQQQYPQAIEHLRQAIELQPESVWAHLEMGSALIKTGDNKTAAIHLEIAATRLPKFALAHILLAQAYEHLGRTEEAKRERALGAK